MELRSHGFFYEPAGDDEGLGALDDGRIREVRRANFAPRVPQVAH